MSKRMVHLAIIKSLKNKMPKQLIFHQIKKIRPFMDTGKKPQKSFSSKLK
jgi:hypothetical protein